MEIKPGRYRHFKGGESPVSGLAKHSETGEATVKAECCRECGKWVKILYQNKNPTLEPIADDVASLGLDMLMRDTEWERGGYNPFLMGY